MARYLGIDVGPASVRAVLLRSTYRKTEIEGLGECEIVSSGEGGVSTAEAVRRAAGDLVARADHVGVLLSGDQSLWRVLNIPATAAKQLAEVVPFEVEAQIPFDLEDAVYDYRPLPKGGDKETLPLMVTVAQKAHVAARIAEVSDVLGKDVEQVVPGNFALAGLSIVSPELAAKGPIALIDLGVDQTELLLLEDGQPVFARTLSVGTKGLPASAALLAQQLRQTLLAYRSRGGGAPEVLYLSGGASSVSGASAYLGAHLQQPVEALPLPLQGGLSQDQIVALPGYLKAMAIAVGMSKRGGAYNLRQGDLAFESGFGFLREKVPVLAGLASAVAVSFCFATWAEIRSLNKQKETLEDTLAAVSKNVLGKECRDAETALGLLNKGPGGQDKDPKPKVDAFDVLVQLSELIPKEMTHDVLNLEVKRGGQKSPPKVSLKGVVPVVKDAETLQTKFKEYSCFQNVKLVKTNRHIGGKGQKYHMEFVLRCPTKKKGKKSKKKGAGSTAGKASK